MLLRDFTFDTVASVASAWAVPGVETSVHEALTGVGSVP
jgi:hypothetical protein